MQKSWKVLAENASADKGAIEVSKKSAECSSDRLLFYIKGRRRGGGLIGRQEKKVLESTEELRVEQRIKSGTLKSFEFFTPVFLCCRRSDGFGIMSTDGDRDEVKARKVK